MIHDTYLTIIQKHIGFKMILAYVNSTGTVSVEPITLQDADKKGIKADLLKSGLANQNIPFFDNFNKTIICLYNTNGIDLLIAKKVENLGVKLKDKAKQKTIISALKGALGQKVVTVVKVGNDYCAVNGIFQNMGIVGISLSVPPFYNRIESLKYPSVMNIFDTQFNDLIYID